MQTTTTTTTTTLSDNATLLDRNGFILRDGVTVLKHVNCYGEDDDYVTIGGNAYPLSDIDDSHPGSLVSLAAGWCVVL